MNIIITLPHFIPNEAEQIVNLLATNACDYMHIRKPDAAERDVIRIIEQIPSIYYRRISLHDHHNLAVRYGLGGIHLNSRHSHVPIGFEGRISRSCHSLEEVKQYKEAHDYLFLSPIFDSISKPDYHAAFRTDELQAARAAGIIDKKVIALGGITANRLEEVARMGFGGGAIMSAAWQQSPLVVLTIAGSDSSGGAGIQADMKTISALGGYAASAITAITAQNTVGVQAIHPIPPEMIAAQITAVMDDLPVDAIKIGMVNDNAIVVAIADTLKKYSSCPIVFDPVMISTSGHRLIHQDTIDIIKKYLFPIASLITPNLHEASVLLNRSLNDVDSMKQAAKELSATYGTAVLVKGGHLADEEMCDVLFAKGSFHLFKGKRIDSNNLHGTGCTLSSAIATLLAQGHDLPTAVAQAKEYITHVIRLGQQMHLGHGHGPVWHFR